MYAYTCEDYQPIEQRHTHLSAENTKAQALDSNHLYSFVVAIRLEAQGGRLLVLVIGFPFMYLRSSDPPNRSTKDGLQQL